MAAGPNLEESMIQRETMMPKSLVCLLLLAIHVPASGDWFFRGTPNGWGSTPMETMPGTQTLEVCEIFQHL